MIGNAVPVGFAICIAEQIYKDMTRLGNIKPSFRKKGKIIKLQ